MNEIFIAIIILSCAMFLSFWAGCEFETIRNRKLLARHKVGGPGFDDLYYQGKRIEAKDTDFTSVSFLPEPDNKILQDIKDQESGLSEFYKTIEKPSNDEK